jgi:hypothetical protein
MEMVKMDVNIHVEEGIYEFEAKEFNTFTCLSISLKENPKHYETVKINIYFKHTEQLKDFLQKLQETTKTLKKIPL